MRFARAVRSVGVVLSCLEAADLVPRDLVLLGFGGAAGFGGAGYAVYSALFTRAFLLVCLLGGRGFNVSFSDFST